MAFNLSLSQFPNLFNVHIGTWLDANVLQWSNTSDAGDRDGNGENDDFDDA